MASQAHTPIHPVSVIRAARALDLHISADRGPIVRIQAEGTVGRLEDPPSPLIYSPVFARRPALFLVRMPVDSPGTEHRIEHVVDLGEDARTRDVRVVMSPADNHRIQMLDQRALFRMTMAMDHCAEILLMPADGFFAGRNTRLKALQTTLTILT